MLYKSTFTQNQKFVAFALLSIFLSLAQSNPVSSKDLGRGFFDHRMTTSISYDRDAVDTVDGNGRNVVLLWLFDHRGSYALLLTTKGQYQYQIAYPTGLWGVWTAIISRQF